MNAGKFKVFAKILIITGSLLALANAPANAELLIGISFPSQGGGDNDVVGFDSSDPQIDESLLTLPKLHLQDSSWYGTENRTIPSTLYWCETTITFELSSKYIEYFTGSSPSYSYWPGSAGSDLEESYSTTLDAPSLTVPRELLSAHISLDFSGKERPNSSAASNSSTSGSAYNALQPVTGILKVTLNQDTLQLDWPADHIGWVLQTQTNPGINSQWLSIPGSSLTNRLDQPLDRANPSVFFRLIAP
jgi:hypothetical protein